MSIFEAIAVFLIGCLVGVGCMIRLTSWVEKLWREANDIQMEIDRLKAETETEDGSVD